MTDGLIVSMVKALARRGTPPDAEYSNSGYAGVMFSQDKAMKTGVDLYRSWARTPWIHGAIGVRKDQIASAEYEVAPVDPTAQYSKRLVKEIKFLFDHPNPRDRSFRAFVTPVIDDLMTLDSGCVELIETGRRDLRYIFPVDSKHVRVARDWDGLDGDTARYFWYPNGIDSGRAWRNSQFLMLMQNSTTYTPLGLSPIEILRMTIDALLYGGDYNRRQVRGAAPEGLLHLGEGVPPDKVEQFRTEWQAYQQQGGALAIIGGGKNPDFKAFRQSNRDMQFLEWLRWLVMEIAIVYRESIQDLQQMFDINRATGDNLAEQSEDRGLRPLADLIQDEFTQQIVWHPSFGGPDNNLCFRFTNLKIRDSYERARTHDLALAHFPKLTPNEARVDDGRKPIGSLTDPDNPFNQLLANTSQGLVRVPAEASEIPTPAELAQMKDKAKLAAQGGSEAPAPANGQRPATPALAGKGPTEEN